MAGFTRSFPTLETERLVLRIPHIRDSALLLAFHKRNEEHFAATSPAVPERFYTQAFWEDYIRLVRRQFQEGTSCRFVAFLKDEPSVIVSKVNFTQIFRAAFQACYLGYAVDVDHEAKGFMFESANAGISYVFGRLNLHRIMANYLPTNERSGRLLRRLGFQVEGYARDYLMIDGEWRDHIQT